MGRRLVVLTLLGLLARAAFLVLEPRVERRGDEPSWIDMAVHDLAGLRHPLSPWGPRLLFYPPLYPYLLAASHHFTGGLPLAQWLQVGLSALLIPAVGLMGARGFSPRSGILAAAVVAFYPDLIWFAAHFLSETLFLTLLFWGLERALAADAPEARLAALASGILLGLAALTRETALPVSLLAAAWLFWGGRGQNTMTGRLRAALLLLGTVLVVAPWTVRNWMVFRTFIPVSTYGALNLWVGNSRLDRDEVYRQSGSVEGQVAQYRLARERALEAIVSRQPGWIVQKLRTELPRLLAPSSEAAVFVEDGAYGDVGPALGLMVHLAVAVPWVTLLLLGGPGLALLPASRPRCLLLAFFIYYVAVHVVAFGHHRFHLPLVPVLALLGVAACLEKRRPGKWAAVGAGALLAGAVLCLLLPS